MDDKDKCKGCKGKKVEDKTKEIEVFVEPGCPNEHDYIYAGECNEGVHIYILK